jgi:uncharacterized protein with PIN domain
VFFFFVKKLSALPFFLGAAHRSIFRPLCPEPDDNGKRFNNVKRSFATALKNAELERCPECNHEAEKSDSEELCQGPQVRRQDEAV